MAISPSPFLKQSTPKWGRWMRAAFWIALIQAIISPAWSEEMQRFTYSRPTMGTVFTVTLYAADEALAQSASEAALQRVEDINQVASDYLPESELSRLNRAPDHQAIPLSPDLFRLLDLSLKTAQVTDGAFDITCTYAVQLWRRARRQHKMPTQDQVDHAIAMTDWRALKLDPTKNTVMKLKPDLQIDLGGIGKGYAAHEALQSLKRRGLPQALVAGSGDLAIGDPPPGEAGWDVTLRTFEKPEEKDRLVHIRLKNCGCSTSGDLHQFLELDGQRYSHIVDPKTGLGLTHRIACTIIAPTGADSDAYDTPMCVLGKEAGLKLVANLPGVSARFVLLGEKGEPEVFTTPGFPTSEALR